MNIIISLVNLIVGIVILFAILKLFTIANLLKEILSAIQRADASSTIQANKILKVLKGEN